MEKEETENVNRKLKRKTDSNFKIRRQDCLELDMDMRKKERNALFEYLTRRKYGFHTYCRAIGNV